MYKRNKRGSIILPSGETITKKVQSEYKKVVASLNRKRKKQIAELPDFQQKRYNNMGIESDFIYRKKSTSFKKFHNLKHFKAYFNELKRMNKKGFQSRAIQTYRRNLLRAINKVYNSAGSPLVKFIKSLSDEQLRRISMSGEFEDIGYTYYAPISVTRKIERLNFQMDKLKKKGY